jgi:hypothetical protein
MARRIARTTAAPPTPAPMPALAPVLRPLLSPSLEEEGLVVVVSAGWAVPEVEVELVVVPDCAVLEASLLLLVALLLLLVALSVVVTVTDMYSTLWGTEADDEKVITEGVYPETSVHEVGFMGEKYSVSPFRLVGSDRNGGRVSGPAMTPVSVLTNLRPGWR